jgi:molecular chaperone DnaK
MSVIEFRKKAKSNSKDPIGQSIRGTENSSLVSPPSGAKAIGIDLGTTNSVVSIYTPGTGHPETLQYESENLVPSMIYWDEIESRDVVGSHAKRRLENDPAMVVRSTKRSMGLPSQLFSSGEKQYSPEDAATAVLKYLGSHPELRNEAEAYGTTHAVVTVPAHFNDAARQATIAAARDAGINVLRIVNEPTAAALAYSMLPGAKEVPEESLAVYDLGGGTFDVSIVDREGFVFNVLASEGDVHLGGDDLDEALASHLLKFVKPELAARRTTKDSECFAKLLYHAEKAKIAFQSQGEYQVVDSDLDGRGAHLNTSITRDTFEELAAPFVQRTLELTERAMHAAKRRPSQISRILLVGGSSRLTLVRKMLEGYFPHCMVDARLEPDLAVSWGASLQAAMILGIEPETILVDVCSHTLGIGVAEDSRAVNENFMKVAKKFGINHTVSEEELTQMLGDKLEAFNFELQGLLRVAPIIHRNSPLPARRSEFFSTLYDNQAAVHVVVAQGEKESVGENKLIGSFLFELQQPVPAGSRCEIQLTYDVNGMVHVLARQIGTQREAEAEFDSRTGEVIGWTTVGEGGTNSEMLPESINNDEKPTPLFSKKSARLLSVVAPSESSHSESKQNDVSENSLQSDGVLNGVIVRARRAMMALGNDSKEFHQLKLLLSQYETLMFHARSGVENDAELEKSEEAILEYLDGLGR